VLYIGVAAIGTLNKLIYRR